MSAPITGKKPGTIPACPLAANGFQPLNESLYLYSPQASITPPSAVATSTSSTDPEVILLFGWGNAAPKAIILLFLTTFSDLFLHTPTRQAKPLDAAVRRLFSMADDDTSRSNHPRILVHLFSNAGAYKFRELARFYHQATSSGPIPVNMIVLDSAPGHPSFRRRIVGMQTQLPRQIVMYWLGTGLLFFMMCIATFLGLLFQWAPLLDQVWHDLNDVSNNVQLVDQNTRRLYLYSKKDELVDWRNIVEHASDAQVKGHQVQIEEFMNSKHVAHVLVDGKRYWDLIRQGWKEATNDS
ncbi:MAG: hypothetical protein GOMPHAMPRED_005407 [Gomphillus americanus]|uniref:Indole-diterpene biosynthesis protein PaxU n=1 Tax=Gomphillus americanus TaxID=1940652 RepID=A0A8H3IQB7_9LECA|nr:MAG: hypothetical protein GOMPHAMPRED_005407 [Gomphillus americanus]